MHDVEDGEDEPAHHPAPPSPPGDPSTHALVITHANASSQAPTQQHAQQHASTMTTPHPDDTSDLYSLASSVTTLPPGAAPGLEAYVGWGVGVGGVLRGGVWPLPTTADLPPTFHTHTHTCLRSGATTIAIASA